jgi:ADP-ribosylglycohydrolase
MLTASKAMGMLAGLSVGDALGAPLAENRKTILLNMPQVAHMTCK